MRYKSSRGAGAPLSNWEGSDGRINWISLQGKLLTWQVKQPPTQAITPKKRGNITEFTRAARLRMLKLIATIDWTAAKPCLFVTLTFPDECKPDHKNYITQARSVFWRYLEKYLGRPATGIWRIEWEPRKSGSRVGCLMPHFHIILLRTQFISYKLINEWWGKSLRFKGYLRTEVKGMQNESQAAAYVAKYCAKLPECTSLVNPSYLNTPIGRHWGILRKAGMPFCQKTVCKVGNTDEASVARDLAEGVYTKRLWTGNESFTVFGPLVEMLRREFSQLGLDFREETDDTT